jgi:NADPH:quinone reductase-like Zn-dependent oxidoreductase
MKAVIYTKYGSPDVLQLKEVEKPIPKDDEVLIKVHAAEATKTDCELRSFKFQVKWFWLPLRVTMGLIKPKRQILGGYFAGEVESVGKNVSKFKKGDQIYGTTKLRLGAYGEYVCLPASYTLVPKPHNVSFEVAAAVPLGGLNALHFLRKANIRKGEKVLVNGAGGSIGTFGVLIAKAMGAEVTAVDSTLKEEMLRRIGADHFFDYTKEDYTKKGQTFDVIFDMVAQSSYSECVKALSPRGRYLMANPRMSDMLRSILTSTFTDKKAIFVFAGEKEEELLTLKEMIEEGKIQPIFDKIFPLEQIAEAHRRVETEQRLGPVVISVGKV